MEEKKAQYSKFCERYKEVRDLQDAELIRGIQVVAMTTTGTSKYRTILQSIKPKIIIVEEAAEVLESHIITTLNENCEHLILIGDHQQLRPTPAVYHLAKKYNLEISLFERMVNNKLNYETLELQHRMRPEISKLMRHIYPKLNDHPSVMNYHRILGVENDIFFITHTQEEMYHEEIRSHSNIHEARFAAELCRYLINQGYKPAQITVLTTYSGQVLQLKRVMPKHDFQGVRVSAVDNFQGEENDIIILSLVRSNKEDSIGFLNIENRVCVALSRARMGFYVVGNLNLLASKSNLWAKIVETLQEDQAIGTKLILRCQNHRENTTLVSSEADFLNCRRGGCDKPCEYELKCGHFCEQPCHVLDEEHKFYKCLKHCEQQCSEGHKCRKRCFEECGKCSEMVLKILPVCSHEQNVPCHLSPYNFECRLPCSELLSCGHKCNGTCGSCSKNKMHMVKCQVMCTRPWPCGHDVKTLCYQTHEDFPCLSKCNATLECGHKCCGTCEDCFQGRIHIPCQEKCKNVLICGHICNQECGLPCKPCSKKCLYKCQHRNCGLQCGIPCNSCKERCEYQCEHESCSKLCHEFCDRLPCDLPCNKKLECNHQCMGLCGEPCPPICFKCDENKAVNIYSNCTADTKFVVLEGCRHVFEITFMDKWMSQDSSDTGRYIEMLQCPKCHVPITNSMRYGNIIKKIRLPVEMVKKHLYINEKEVEKKRNALSSILQRQGSCDVAFKERTIQLLKKKKIPVDRIYTIQNQIKFLSWLEDITRRNSNRSEIAQRFLKDIDQNLERVKIWISQSKTLVNKKTGIVSHARLNFTRQEIREGECELLRLEYLLKFKSKLLEDRLVRGIYSNTGNDIKIIINMLRDGKPLDVEREKDMEREYRRLVLSQPRTAMNESIKCPERRQSFTFRGSYDRTMLCKCPCGRIIGLENQQEQDSKVHCKKCDREFEVQSINRSITSEQNEEKVKETFDDGYKPDQTEQRRASGVVESEPVINKADSKNASVASAKDCGISKPDVTDEKTVSPVTKRHDMLQPNSDSSNVDGIDYNLPVHSALSSSNTCTGTLIVENKIDEAFDKANTQQKEDGTRSVVTRFDTKGETTSFKNNSLENHEEITDLETNENTTSITHETDDEEIPGLGTEEYTNSFRNVTEENDVEITDPGTTTATTSLMDDTEKNNDEKKSNVWVWFRCKLGHLFSKQRDDKDMDVCSTCGDKQGGTLL